MKKGMNSWKRTKIEPILKYIQKIKMDENFISIDNNSLERVMTSRKVSKPIKEKFKHDHEIISPAKESRKIIFEDKLNSSFFEKRELIFTTLPIKIITREINTPIPIPIFMKEKDT